MAAITLRDTPQKRQAARIAASLAATVESIRKSNDLSPDGKRRQIAKAYIEAKNALAPLRQQEAAQTAATRQRLERTLYGATGRLDPSQAISRRDAADRAARANTLAAANALLDQAERSGDDELASAVARHAAYRGWLDVTVRYAQQRPEANAALQKLAEIDAEVKGEGPMGQAAFTVPRPQELAGVAEHQLATLADELTIAQ